MCFSATASFIAGGALAAVGSASLAQAKTKKEIPFASIPLWFALQQIADGVVWLSFGVPAVHTVAVYIYTLFAYVFWPIFLPVSILLIESDPSRRNILKLFSFLGAFIGLYFLNFIASDGVTVAIVNKCVAYDVPHPYLFSILALYVIATCGACLFSSHRVVRLIGVLLSVALAVSGWFYFTTFVSVWCLFAALLSVLVYWHVRGGSTSGLSKVISNTR